MYNINSIFIPVSKNNEGLGDNIWETVPIYYIVIFNRRFKKKKKESTDVKTIASECSPTLKYSQSFLNCSQFLTMKDPS